MLAPAARYSIHGWNPNRNRNPMKKPSRLPVTFDA
jgi:hypothetical protein